jgi:hypothetical protein
MPGAGFLSPTRPAGPPLADSVCPPGLWRRLPCKLTEPQHAAVVELLAALCCFVKDCYLSSDGFCRTAATGPPTRSPACGLFKI